MIKVLFICHGNICRSVMAEYMFKDKVEKLGINSSFYCESRATSREEIGNDIYPPAKRTLTRHQIPYQRHRATQVTQKDYEEFDYLLVMDENNIRNINRIVNNNQNKIRKLLDRDVADPWYTDDFETTYNDLKEGIDNFLKEIKEGK